MFQDNQDELSRFLHSLYEAGAAPGGDGDERARYRKIRKKPGYIGRRARDFLAGLNGSDGPEQTFTAAGGPEVAAMETSPGGAASGAADQGHTNDARGSGNAQVQNISARGGGTQTLEFDEETKRFKLRYASKKGGYVIQRVYIIKTVYNLEKDTKKVTHSLFYEAFRVDPGRKFSERDIWWTKGHPALIAEIKTKATAVYYEGLTEQELIDAGMRKDPRVGRYQKPKVAPRFNRSVTAWMKKPRESNVAR